MSLNSEDQQSRELEYLETKEKLKKAQEMIVELSHSSLKTKNTVKTWITEEIKPIPLKKILEGVEKRWIIRALSDNRGNQFRAAIQLGISRGTLISRMREFGLSSKSRGDYPND